MQCTSLSHSHSEPSYKANTISSSGWLDKGYGALEICCCLFLSDPLTAVFDSCVVSSTVRVAMHAAGFHSPWRVQHPLLWLVHVGVYDLPWPCWYLHLIHWFFLNKLFTILQIPLLLCLLYIQGLDQNYLLYYTVAVKRWWGFKPPW